MHLKTKRVENRHLLDTYHKMRCIVCSRYGSDPAHIKSKGAGGDDTAENILPLCRIHHSEQHSKGHIHMIKKYYSYDLALRARGWEVIQDKLRKK